MGMDGTRGFIREVGGGVETVKQYRMVTVGWPDRMAKRVAGHCRTMTTEELKI